MTNEKSPLLPSRAFSNGLWKIQVGLAIGFVAVLSLVVLIATQTGRNPKSEQNSNLLGLVGGNEAIPHEFPSVVEMRRGRRWSRQFTCAGTIISREWVLTAAHCVAEDSSPNSYDLRAGKHNLNENEESQQVRSIRKIVVHPQYSAELNENDVALLQVSRPFDLNENVQTVQLPDPDFRASGSVFVVGWGAIYFSGPTSDVLLKVEQSIVDDETCRRTSNHNAYKTIPDSVICVGGEKAGTGPCNGDSGGPIFQTDKNGAQTHVGVTSWGVGCAEKGTPGVFMETAYFVKWIKDTTGI